MILSQLRNLVFVQGGEFGAIGVINVLPWRGHRVGIGVDISVHVRRHGDHVKTVLFADAREAAALQAYAVQLALDRRFLRRGEVNNSFRFINAVNAGHFPIAFSQLGKFLSIHPVEI
jgi:hypothetical protein